MESFEYVTMFTNHSLQTNYKYFVIKSEKIKSNILELVNKVQRLI
jgi:Txe/YoeB family toxin of Txe-Axe toxin-antitoxin module